MHDNAILMQRKTVELAQIQTVNKYKMIKHAEMDACGDMSEKWHCKSGGKGQSSQQAGRDNC